MTEIILRGFINEDTPAEIRAGLARAKGGPVDLLINSPGGQVIAGMEVYNALKSYPGRVTVRIVGQACSMASFIACAASKVVAAAASVLMAHEVSGGTYGTKDDLLKAATIFEGFNRMLAETYAARTGKTIAEIRDIMTEERFFFGREIVEAGFADEVNGEPTEGKTFAVERARREASEAVAQAKARETADYPLQLAAVAGLQAGSSIPATASPQAIAALIRADYAKRLGLTDAQAEEARAQGITLDAYAIRQARAVNPALSAKDVSHLTRAGMTVAEIRQYSKNGVMS